MLLQQSRGEIPAAIMRHEHDVPMVAIGPGVSIQLLQVDFEHNIRVTRALLAPGLKLSTHIHTGCVYAWTLSGSWKYLEYPEANVANTYLYEPAGSRHTLVVSDESNEPADVIFIVNGSNVDHDEEGGILSVTDSATIARAYLKACNDLGYPRPKVIGLPDAWNG